MEIIYSQRRSGYLSVEIKEELILHGTTYRWRDFCLVPRETIKQGAKAVKKYVESYAHQHIDREKKEWKERDKFYMKRVHCLIATDYEGQQLTGKISKKPKEWEVYIKLEKPYQGKIEYPGLNRGYDRFFNRTGNVKPFIIYEATNMYLVEVYKEKHKQEKMKKDEEMVAGVIMELAKKTKKNNK